MGFWDWADKHTVALVIIVLIIGLSLPSFRYESGSSKSGGGKP